MASAPKPLPPGVHLNADAVDVSQQSVDGVLQAIDHHWTRFLETVERIWVTSLDWSSKNPVQFTGVLLLIAWWLVQRRLAIVGLRRHDERI
jgi:hypothetical protein